MGHLFYIVEVAGTEQYAVISRVNDVAIPTISRMVSGAAVHSWHDTFEEARIARVSYELTCRGVTIDPTWSLDDMVELYNTMKNNSN